MELIVDSDIYEPNIDDNSNYTDYLPPSSKFKDGLRCPCGARKDHVFDSRQSFSIHIKKRIFTPLNYVFKNCINSWLLAHSQPNETPKYLNLLIKKLTDKNLELS